MKFSVRQILASAGGAVLAAIIASFFGVKGTIIGVAIGSAAATSGTALVAQSIERGHKAVQQVVVRVPDRTSLLRRLGGTGAVGLAAASAEPAASLADETTNAAVVPEPPTVAAEEEQQPATADIPVSAPRPELAPLVQDGRRIRWPAIAGTAAVIFVLSLMFVTAVELIAGRPLANLFGGHVKGGGPSIVKIFETPTTTAPAPTTTTSSTSTTTTSTLTPDTSTTVVGTTSSTDAGSTGSTTTSTNVTSGGETTTTSAATGG